MASRCRKKAIPPGFSLRHSGGAAWEYRNLAISKAHELKLRNSVFDSRRFITEQNHVLREAAEKAK